MQPPCNLNRLNPFVQVFYSNAKRWTKGDYDRLYVLIPLFRSFILIRKTMTVHTTSMTSSLNPFVQVFYSNDNSLVHEGISLYSLNPFVQVFYSNKPPGTVEAKRRRSLNPFVQVFYSNISLLWTQ